MLIRHKMVSAPMFKTLGKHLQTDHLSFLETFRLTVHHDVIKVVDGELKGDRRRKVDETYRPDEKQRVSTDPLHANE